MGEREAKDREIRGTEKKGKGGRLGPSLTKS